LKSRTEQKYSYTFRLRAEDPTSLDSCASRDEIQLFVNTSLGMLTGGCELCKYAHYNNSPAMFCEKKKFPINWGSPRCEEFVRASAPALELTR